jgi:two-component system chemotaxis response regulator CheB
MSYEAVVIGASAGGLNAFVKVLGPLPSSFSLPIIIVQHLLDQDDSYLTTHLSRVCALPVTEAMDKEPIKQQHIYVSPPSYHCLIETKKQISLSADPPVNYSRPSIDLLFETAADAYREKLICILMTGANSDGAKGMRHVHELGGMCIVQDPKTASSSMMPQAAIEETKVDFVMTLDEIAQWLIDLGKKDE